MSSEQIAALALQLFASKQYTCGEEILTIAAMTSIQDVFVIPNGASGALAELERRKFTANEGVCSINQCSSKQNLTKISGSFDTIEW
jgi:HrpA-like RNA helicase